MPTNETKESKQLKLDLRYLRMARIWAENSYCQRRKVGALVVKEKMIISRMGAYRKTKTRIKKSLLKIPLRFTAAPPPPHPRRSGS